MNTSTPTEKPSNADAAQPEEQTSASLADMDELPAVPLDSDTMYQLLTAEVAAQRGEWQTAYWMTLAVAQRTHDPRLAQRAFEIAWAAKLGEEALAASRLWRALAPHSEEATQNYLNAVVMADRLEEARLIFERLLKDTSEQTRGPLLFQIQHLLNRAKDKNAAFTVLESLTKPYPDLVESHLVLAYGAYAKEDNARAREEAQIALKSKPDSEQGMLVLAQATENKDEALGLLAKFLATHPAAKELRLAYARILVEQKRDKDAAHEFGILLKAQPHDLNILYLLSILEIQMNDTKAAEEHLTTFLDELDKHPNEDRDPTSALLLLSQISEDRKDYQAALKWLDEIDSQEAYTEVQIRRAEIFAKDGNVEGARKLLARLAPNDATQQLQVISSEAQILRDANRVAEAMQVLEAGLKRFPDNTDLLYDYAMDAEKSNQLDICETALRKIIALAPKSQQAYNALGYTFAERNVHLDEAYTLVDTALKLAPNDPFIIDSMGWVQFRLGKLDEAEQLLRRAYAINPDPEIAVHLGEILWTKGKKADAQKVWHEVSVKDPGNDSLKSTLARLHTSL